MPLNSFVRTLAAGVLALPLAAGAAALTDTLALNAIQSLGLDPRTTFAVRRTTPDVLLGGMDVRVDQYYQGVRVMGGEAIVHLRAGRVRAITNGLKRRFTLDAKPALTASEALAVAVADLAPRGAFARPPTCELVVARMKLGPGTPRLRDALVYRVLAELENGVQETIHAGYLVDAQTGAITKKWNNRVPPVGVFNFGQQVCIRSLKVQRGPKPTAILFD